MFVKEITYSEMYNLILKFSKQYLANTTIHVLKPYFLVRVVKCPSIKAKPKNLTYEVLRVSTVNLVSEILLSLHIPFKTIFFYTDGNLIEVM